MILQRTVQSCQRVRRISSPSAAKKFVNHKSNFGSLNSRIWQSTKSVDCPVLRPYWETRNFRAQPTQNWRPRATAGLSAKRQNPLPQKISSFRTMTDSQTMESQRWFRPKLIHYMLPPRFHWSIPWNKSGVTGTLSLKSTYQAFNTGGKHVITRLLFD